MRPVRQVNSVGSTHVSCGKNESFESLTISKLKLGKLLDLSVRTISRMDSAGLIPRAVRVGMSKRWRYEEIISWVRAGCPARKTWEATQQISPR